MILGGTPYGELVPNYLDQMLLMLFFCRDGEPLSYAMKVMIALLAGSIGAVFGTPSEVVLVRMSVDDRSVIFLFFM